MNNRYKIKRKYRYVLYLIALPIVDMSQSRLNVNLYFKYFPVETQIAL